MSTEFQWEGHRIQINCRPMPKYLWMATETTVKVDEVEIGRAGGFGFTDKISCKFTHNDLPSDLVVEVKIDLLTLVSVPYKLQIDGNVISQGRLKIDNWLLFLAPIAIFSPCLGCSIVIIIYSIIVNNPPR